MSEETPSVEEIKERLKIEVEEEEMPAKATAKPEAEIVTELKQLGRQFAETLQSAWNSEERQRIEGEVREGVQSFVAEVDKVFQEARQSTAAERVREEATELKTRVETTDLGEKTRHSVVQGLRWMSEELARLANKFTPPEKPASPPESEEA